MKLTQLTIHRFRDIEPGTTLRFSEGTNVLLGQNGTGKTTLLKLLAALTSGDLDSLEEEEVEIECIYSGAGATLNAIIRRFRDTDSETIRTYHASVAAMESVAHQLTPVERTEVELQLTFEDGNPYIYRHKENSEQAFIKTTPLHYSFFKLWTESELSSKISTDPETFQSTYPFKGRGRADESLEMFIGLTSPEDSRDQVPESVFRLLFIGEEVIASAESGAIIAPSVRRCLRSMTKDTFGQFSNIGIWFSDEELTESLGEDSFLTIFIKLSGMQNAWVQVEPVSFNPGTPFNKQGHTPPHAGIMGLNFRFQLRDNNRILHTQLSYGQKRLLALLHYLECCPEVVVADELVNGLHHRWIRRCMELMEGKQAFLTSQNPLLLDHIALDSAEDAQRSFILCEVEDGGRWRWRNMTADEAQSLMSAYEVGIQHVGEILQDKGLW